MAQQKVDPREVQKVRAVIAAEGRNVAARRFGTDSPEWRATQQEQQDKKRAAGRRHRMMEESTMSTTDTKKKAQEGQEKQAGAKNSRALQVAAARQRMAAMRTRQAQMKARGIEPSQSAGQGM